MAIRAVVLDLFDTLVDLYMERIPLVEWRGRPIAGTVHTLHETVRERADVEFDRFAETLAGVDREWHRAAREEGRELPTLERFSRLTERLGLADPELPARLTATHMGALEAQVGLVDHHPAVLGALRREARTALCSNFTHSPTALAVLERAGLSEHLDAVVISHDLGLRKPRPEIFEATLRALDVAPEHAIHVGDNLDADVAGAAAVGMRTVWITRRVADPAAARAARPDAEPDWIVNDLGEIQKILREEF